MIPAFDYRPEYHARREEIDAAIARVLASGRLILGEEVRAFEEEFAAFVGTAWAVGVNSGTDALILALRGLEVGPGDEVLTVANAGVPTVAAIRAVGAEPRFVDVRPDTLLMDPAGLEAARSPRTRSVIPVHLYGQPADLDAIGAFCSRHGLSLIEDCAQAHGATWRGRPVGSIGDAAAFSFYPTKNLGAYGDGGLVVGSSRGLERRVRMQRMYGFAGDGHARVEGLNSRLDEIQAAILRVKLRHLAETNAERASLAARYSAGLRDAPCRLALGAGGATHAFHLFVVRPVDRDAWIAALDAAGIGHGIHYPEPVHLMEAYRFLGLVPGTLPCSEQACREVLSLPLYPGLEPRAVDRVVETLLSAS